MPVSWLRVVDSLRMALWRESGSKGARVSREDWISGRNLDFISLGTYRIWHSFRNHHTNGTQFLENSLKFQLANLGKKNTLDTQENSSDEIDNIKGLSPHSRLMVERQRITMTRKTSKDN